MDPAAWKHCEASDPDVRTNEERPCRKNRQGLSAARHSIVQPAPDHDPPDVIETGQSVDPLDRAGLQVR